MSARKLVVRRFGPANEIAVVTEDSVEPRHTVLGPLRESLQDLDTGEYLVTTSHEGGVELRSLAGVSIFGSLFDAEVVRTLRVASEETDQQPLTAYLTQPGDAEGGDSS